jgi:hypothetical protein
MMEKLVDRHIRDSVLKECSLHQNQQAYQTGKSTKTARHKVTHKESVTECKEIALGVFLETKGGYDRTSFDVITQADEKHGNEPINCRWICSMLERRTIITILSGESLRGSTARGSPQRGVLSLPLRSLLEEKLL